MTKSIWFQSISIEDFKDSSVNTDKYLGIEVTKVGNDFIIAKMPVIEKTTIQHSCCSRKAVSSSARLCLNSLQFSKQVPQSSQISI